MLGDEHKGSEDKLLVEDVFTPTYIPTATYVDRGVLADRLYEQLRHKGRPICIDGPFRSGKTTLALTKVSQVFERHIHIVCTPASTFADILLDAFDWLGPFYSEEQGKSTKRVPAGISADFFGLKGQVGGRAADTNSKERRVIPAQLTSRSLATFSAAADAPLIVDDAHKLAPQEFNKLAHAMRLWQTVVLELGCAKMIVIGSQGAGVDVPRSLIAAAPDLTQRLVAISLPMMRADELSEIITKGERALNIDFSEIRDSIIRYSYGFPGVCQDLCAHACAAADITRTCATTARLGADHLQRALEEYVELSTTTIRHRFDQMQSRSLDALPSRFAKITLDLVSSQALAGIPDTELHQKLAASLGLTAEQIKRGLDLLSNEDTGVLRFDVKSGRVHFLEPIYFLCYRYMTAAATLEPQRLALVEQFRRAFHQSTDQL